MSQAIIYSPAKSSMQSGVAKTGYWILELKNEHQKNNDPLMGWVGGSETSTQIKLHFDTLEDAERYARENNLSYIVRHAKRRGLRLKSYAENYAYQRQEPWTH